MFLARKVRGAFGKIEGRDWALLALETVSVIAGLLIAFELNEWSNRRSESRRAELLLIRLFEESEADVASLASVRDFLTKTSDAEQHFAMQVSGGECPDEQGWGAVGTVGLYPALSVPSGVYEEMMGSGGLADLPDDKARNAVQEFRASVAFTASQIDYFRMAVEDPVSTSDPRQRISLSTGTNGGVEVSYDRAALCRDVVFRNKMISATRNHLVIVRTRAKLTGKAIAMCAQLGRLVGRTCRPDGKALTGPDARAAEPPRSA